VGTSSWFPRVLIQNLEYAVHDSSKEIVTSGNEERFSTFIATLNEGLAENRIIREAVARASDAVNFEKKFSFHLLYHAIWHRLTPVDPRQPIIMSSPAKLTNFGWVDDVWSHLLGGLNE